MKAARLPGVTEVTINSPHGPRLTELTEDRLGREVAGQAKAAQIAFEQYAAKRKVGYAFRRVRGRLIERLLEAASQSDLVVVCRSTRAPGLRTRQASHFEPLLDSRRSLLFVNEPWFSGKRIVVLSDPSIENSLLAFETAQRFARAEGLELVALELEPGPNTSPSEAALSGTRLRYIPALAEDEIMSACEAEEARLLVAPNLADIDWRQLLLRLTDRLACSLLKVAVP